MKQEHPEIVCNRCARVLTNATSRVEVTGRHTHEVVNPGGYRFVIDCHAEAPGCIGAGAASHEESWFAGHTWQRAFCRGCSTHVGWLFRARTGVFYGLIRDRVKPVGQTPGQTER